MTDSAVPMAPGAPAPTSQRYQIAGSLNEEFDLYGLRDRIRRGELLPNQEIAIAGTEIWKPASDYPALRRYFDLLQKSAASAERPSQSAPAGSVATRILPGFGYPFTAVTSIALLLLGFLAPVNLLFWVASSIISGVYNLAIIRSSSEGQTKAPEITAVGSAGEWVMSVLRLIAVSVISAWPVIGVMILFFLGSRSVVLVGLAFFVMLIYYPACLASIALWRTVSVALSIKKIFGLIGILGVDYAVSVIAAILVFIGFAVISALSIAAIGSRAAVGVNSVGSLFAMFYASHLLGWACYRHRDQI